MDVLLEHEANLRFYLLIGGFGLVALWESFAPRRPLTTPTVPRWGVNIGLTAVISVLIAWLFPVLAVGTAVIADQRGWGFFNAVNWPGWLVFLLSFLALDLSRYLQHALLHRVSLLWRLHRVHHSDSDYDCTTGLRFHPLEALFTISVQLAVVVALGAPPMVVLMYEGIFTLVAMFSHGNIRIPETLDLWLRKVLVTPDMHRVHHSVIQREMNSNFGAVFPWWDWLFATYRAQPARGHHGMTLGLAELRGQRCVNFAWLLVLPFVEQIRDSAARETMQERIGQ